MKVLVATFLFFSLILSGCSLTSSNTSTATNADVNVKLIGVLKKASSATADFNYILTTDTSTVGINSASVKLDDYVGKKVELTGQYSGTTLYVDKAALKE